MRIKLYAAGLCLLLMICGCGYLLVGSQQDDQAQGDELQTVVRGDIQEMVMLTGTVKPYRKVKVGAQVTGQLKRLYVHDGQHVKQGDLLAEIDPSIQQADLRKAEASLTRAQAQYESAKVMLWQYDAEFRRQSRMKRDDATPQKEYEQARSQFESQKQQLRIEAANVVQAQMDVESARTNLSYTKIHAPMEGDVLAIVTEEGQTIVSSQTATTILVLANLTKMTVGVNIPEVDILKIHPGQPLTFYTVANPDKIWRGKMGQIQSSPDNANKEDASSSTTSGQSTPVYYTGNFDVDNSCRCFRTSMTTHVFVTSAEAKNVLLVPLTALLPATGTARTRVRKQVGDRIVETPVTTGLHDERMIEITSGLSEKDRVVIGRREDVSGA
ncbi:efflux RND transporter periplasmic adaptor subunit [unidentified bacterial endosymbiont]|uniref:efflux RND transporter periplasmic adaptor subunit n=1 Tax=unidentified bacterial endosymbiont TaxID=2355 RepID=UPI00209F4A9E|nr:efflux RND transporter periplasmic adaptor subunit [unidentified bacterial endosymbiont]